MGRFAAGSPTTAEEVLNIGFSPTEGLTFSSRWGDHRYPEHFEIGWRASGIPSFRLRVRRLWRRHPPLLNTNFDAQRNDVRNFRRPESVVPWSWVAHWPSSRFQSSPSSRYPAPRLRKLVREYEYATMRVAGSAFLRGS